MCRKMLSIFLLPVSGIVKWDTKYKFIYITTLITVLRIHGQVNLHGMPSYTGLQDNFDKELCRERWYRLHWQNILSPCLGRTNFGNNNLHSSLATSSSMSRIVKMEIEKAGDYSILGIQTYDDFGNIKTIGGDTWRVFITGPSSLQPFVHDMSNGNYEIPFLIMEPGLYTANIFLEGTLCSQLFDPPLDWFRKGELKFDFL